VKQIVKDREASFYVCLFPLNIYAFCQLTPFYHERRNDGSEKTLLFRNHDFIFLTQVF